MGAEKNYLPPSDAIQRALAETDAESFDIERARQIEEAATQLFIQVWRGITERGMAERGPIADAALVVRDALNPDWPNNPNWLPEPLASEQRRT